MSFIDEGQNLVNPVDFKLDWKGKESDGFFSYWNKETEENIPYNIGKCAIINIGFCVKGFNENLNTGIYSNFIGKWDEEVIVKSKGDILAQGVWKDIRDQVSGFGGSIYKAITMFDTTTGKIIEIYLKGQAGWGIVDKSTKAKIWGGFADIETELKKAMSTIDSKYPTLCFKDKKTIMGKAFNYNVPEFEVTGEFLNKADIEKYIESIELFNKYKEDLKKNISTKKEEVKKPKEEEVKSEGFAEEVEEEISIEDIPF